MSTPEKTLFILGGSGYIGTQIIRLAPDPPYNFTQIRALSRTPATDTHLTNLGATPVRGDLTSHALLEHESRQASAVINLATAYIFGQSASYDVQGLGTDTAALDAIARGLQNTGKPLAMVSGTLIYAPHPSGEETEETSPFDPHPINTRSKTDAYARALGAREGFRAVTIRLAPFVYGRAGSGVGRFMRLAAQNQRVAVVAGGGKRTTTVHVDDAAQLFLLAVEKGAAGEAFNASAETGVTFRELFGAIAEVVGVGIVDLTEEQAMEGMGEMVMRFLSTENRASGKKAREVLGWVPTAPGVLEEIREGSYRVLAEELREKEKSAPLKN
ncbi:oxidoreductase domain-containing protein [Aspergillus saccharolyticus JOP 1030-1]|uniref:Oxidoreductase domain-containing protein n=1 Tax=Aspergillus saccharolyticus JOP 1030-1 TaxID=1450539 RepID=A0A318ZEC4_9EURO|nr:oxidoreductase domain-containing protein [Aspergillus saccharolyticus JOP 1030-1]PYH45886.1 oxidoreductase domain-containing protein [Aspergillus saccharolyticus JOP 1030-1]